jgi:O-antigen ligase
LGNAILQLLAILLIAWALIERRGEASLPRGARQLLIIAALALLLAILHLIPLPARIWTALPGRDFVVHGFELLGMTAPAMPISLSPYDTVATLLALLPPLGMLAATLGLRAYSSSWLALALVSGAMAGVLLGILQVSSPIPEQSPWYPYRISNFGVATGFFANSNHMANLLLVSIPFVAAIGAKLREQSKDVRMRSAGIALASSGLVLAVLGLILNQSLAGYGLGVPVVLASLVILFGLPTRLIRIGLTATGLAGLVAIGLLWTSPVGSQLGASASVTSRQEISANSLALAREFSPVGAGLGTFRKVYPLREDPVAVDRFYVNHAHNDYLELAVDTGLPGVALILLFLIWWAVAVWRMLRSPASDQFALAGAIASAAILLHSAVDYPLRTAAISAVFAMCLALILQSRKSARGENDLRPARHLVVG